MITNPLNRHRSVSLSQSKQMDKMKQVQQKVRQKVLLQRQIDLLRKMYAQKTTNDSLEDGTILSVSRHNPKARPQTAENRSFKQRKQIRTEENENYDNRHSKIEEQDNKGQQQQGPQASAFCYEIDIENMGDDKFAHILPQGCIDVSRFMEENQEYILHMLGQCACGKCVCNKCYCPLKKIDLNYILGFLTSYRQSYTFQQKLPDTPALNQTHYETVAPKTPQIDRNTIQRVSFQKLLLQPRYRRKQRKLVHNQFLSKTLNQHSLINWHDYDPTWIFKAPIHKSVVQGVDLNGTTQYRTVHCKPNISVTPNKSSVDIKRRQMQQQ